MSIATNLPTVRLHVANAMPLRADGEWVVYWMTAFRRTRYNFALQYARDIAKQLNKPLIVLEAIRVRYRWACDRFHRFMIEGMNDNRAALANTNALYYPYVEPQPGAGSGLLEVLAQKACTVISDDFPCFFHLRMMQLVSRTLPSRFELVDSNCLMPLAATDRTFTVAHSYRRFMQKELPKHLDCMPEENPLDGRATRGMVRLVQLPLSITERWPSANLDGLLAQDGLRFMAIDHSIAPTAMVGGPSSAEKFLDRFLTQRLANYDAARNEPDLQGSSELSPYLHFGHISPHEVFLRLMDQLQWHPGKLQQPNGKVSGYWGVSQSAEGFLDQLCTWREIGFNMCWREPHFDHFESLPGWAQQSLDEHALDSRPYTYTHDQLETSRTDDPIWNASQRQLIREGRIHNYLRMLWGKKILQWSPTPRDALQRMIELNNKYALDGRDPNSYSGIFWVLGRYDRAWGPERPIFGKIRYMTSENTARKHALREYLKRFQA